MPWPAGRSRDPPRRRRARPGPGCDARSWRSCATIARARRPAQGELADDRGPPPAGAPPSRRRRSSLMRSDRYGWVWKRLNPSGGRDGREDGGGPPPGRRERHDGDDEQQGDVRRDELVAERDEGGRGARGHDGGPGGDPTVGVRRTACFRCTAGPRVRGVSAPSRPARRASRKRQDASLIGPLTAVQRPSCETSSSSPSPSASSAWPPSWWRPATASSAPTRTDLDTGDQMAASERRAGVPMTFDNGARPAPRPPHRGLPRRRAHRPREVLT